MEREQADKWFINNENKTLWINEATGNYGKNPHKNKYSKGMLYVIWDKDDEEVEVYDTSNIYGECEYEETLKFFNNIKERKGDSNE